MQDNVVVCRARLRALVLEKHTATVGMFTLQQDVIGADVLVAGVPAFQDYCLALDFLLSKNIIWGDALTLQRVDGTGEPIVFAEQLFGMAITELTALMSRRTLYCSTNANGQFSVCDAFDDADGHVFFPVAKHVWHNGKCALCGANEAQYDRDATLESHSKPWTDEALYAKYGLEPHEIAFIESMIRPMDIATPQSADEAVRDGNEGEDEGVGDA